MRSVKEIFGWWWQRPPLEATKQGGKSLTDVCLKHVSIGCVDFIPVDMGDGTCCQVTVWLQKCLQISFAWRDATTSQWPLGNQHVAESFVVLQSFSHLLLGCAHCFLVGFGVFDEL
jgi:hypothetical protein